MIGDIAGLDWGLLAAIYMGLLLFGIGYNGLTAWAERRGYLSGYTSLAVVVGVGVTLAVVGIIAPLWALITVGAFIMSGAPMIAGSIWRHVKERERELEQLRQEALRGDAK